MHVGTDPRVVVVRVGEVRVGGDLAGAVCRMDALRQIVEVGTPEHFFTDPQEERTKLFLSQIL